MKIVPFENDRHRGFVLPTFSMQAGLPGATIDRLVRAGATVLVAEAPSNLPTGALCPQCGQEVGPFRCPVTNEEHWLFYGWAGVMRNALIWCYVKTKLVGLRLDPRLMTALGVDTTKKIPCLFTGSPLRMMGQRYGWRFDWQADKAQDALTAGQGVSTAEKWKDYRQAREEEHRSAHAEAHARKCSTTS